MLVAEAVDISAVVGGDKGVISVRDGSFMETIISSRVLQLKHPIQFLFWFKTLAGETSWDV